MSYTNKDCDDLINYIIINNPNSISLKKFFILFSERLLTLCDEEFLDKILFIFNKENTNKFEHQNIRSIDNYIEYIQRYK